MSNADQPITLDDDLPIVVRRGREMDPDDPRCVLVATDVIRDPSLPWEVKTVYNYVALMVDSETRAGVLDRELLDDLGWPDSEVNTDPEVEGPPRITVAEALAHGTRVGLWTIDGDTVQLHDDDDQWHPGGDREVLPEVRRFPWVDGSADEATR